MTERQEERDEDERRRRREREEDRLWGGISDGGGDVWVWHVCTRDPPEACFLFGGVSLFRVVQSIQPVVQRNM